MAKGKRYDWTTRVGRAELDEDVRALLDSEKTLLVLLPRHVIASRLRIDLRDERAMDAVTASLRRGVKAGWARQDGERGQTRYAAAK